jgi:hypothetical protein
MDGGAVHRGMKRTLGRAREPELSCHEIIQLFLYRYS